MNSGVINLKLAKPSKSRDKGDVDGLGWDSRDNRIPIDVTI